MTEPKPNVVTVLAEESANLDVVCYRGTAALADLTRLSQVDVFDQVSNPDGLQRDLNKRHALDAYDYVAREADPTRPRAFPEVMLNVRDPKVVEIGSDPSGRATLTFDLEKIQRAKTVKVSASTATIGCSSGPATARTAPPLRLLCRSRSRSASTATRRPRCSRTSTPSRRA
jgi:hypothetical protein